ncbi:uncharacterized protein BDW43DRAFT_262761 [Aspergillus alliaceus]|uniref:uncharacterized protein n=1 Tax=Petromyces alliaceus TaxID=209559 RepID=UPI0012A6D619|nr:uncharacterized protein BDW43DRAFT_262761 [Aspergillus alliaceus]KAB8237990.1 hypothetical protein BDW43DRAFT_262761 [Aspergillus alliaceus]
MYSTQPDLSRHSVSFLHERHKPGLVSFLLSRLNPRLFAGFFTLCFLLMSVFIQYILHGEGPALHLAWSWFKKKNFSLAFLVCFEI